MPGFEKKRLSSRLFPIFAAGAAITAGNLKGIKSASCLFNMNLQPASENMKAESLTQASDKANASQLLEDILRWKNYLMKYWWLVLLFALAGGAAGFFYAKLKKPLYEAELTFALEDNSGGGGFISGAMGLASELGLSLGGAQDIFGGENILPIITSRKIIERVLLKSDTNQGKVQTYADAYIDANLAKSLSPSLSKVRFKPGTTRDTFTPQQDSLMNLMYDQTIKKRLFAGRTDRRYSIFKITFTSGDERFSKMFTTELIHETTKFYTELRTQKSKNLLTVLEERVNNLKGNLTGAISRQQSYKDANLNPTYSSSLTPILSEEINKRAYGEAYSTLFANLEMARLQYLKDVPLLQVIDEPVYPLKKLQKSVPVYAAFGLFAAGIMICSILSLLYLIKRR